MYDKLTRIIIKIYLKINKYLSSAYELFNTNNISMLPAYIAFFTLWSIVPLIILWDTLEKFVPKILGEQSINNQTLVDAVDFMNVDYSISDGGIVLIILIIYLSSKPFMSIISASNYIYNITDTNILKSKLKSIILSLLLIFTIILLLIIPVLGEKILMILEKTFTSLNIVDTANIFKWPITIVYLLVVLSIIYSFSPNERIKLKYFLPGTIFATVGWLVATYLYSIYVNEFANYHKIYSSFTSVIILMIWLYLISYILIIGLVINAAYFKEKFDVKS